MNRILASFHTNTPSSIIDLRAAHTTANRPTAAAVAHKLRPSLRLLGAISLMPYLEMLEAKEASAEAQQAATQQLTLGLDELLAALPKEISA